LTGNLLFMPWVLVSLLLLVQLWKEDFVLALVLP
jgi:hypothetical protein